MPALGGGNETRGELDERSAPRERPPPPAQPAACRASGHARRANGGARRGRRQRDRACNDDDSPDVDAPAEKPNRWRSHPMATSVAAAAKTESATERLRCDREKPSWLAVEVAAIKRTP